MDAPKDAPGASLAPKPVHILVVEHHPMITRYLRMYLELQGYRVQTVGNVNSARAALAVGGIDVLLTDVYLPGETCFALLRSGEPLPPLVITMSGFDVQDRAGGVDGAPRWPHLVKPFAAEELDRLLERFAAVRNAERVPATGGAV